MKLVCDNTESLIEIGRWNSYETNGGVIIAVSLKPVLPRHIWTSPRESPESRTLLKVDPDLDRRVPVEFQGEEPRRMVETVITAKGHGIPVPSVTTLKRTLGKSARNPR